MLWPKQTLLVFLLPLATVTASMLPVGINDEVADLPTMSRQECTDEWNGIVVGDIGNGAIHAPDYLCESNGQRPIGTIVPSPGEPIAIEGEVCCGPPTVEGGDGGVGADPNTSLPQDLPDDNNNGTPPNGGGPPSIAYLDVDLSPAECEEQGNIVVGDIGDGAIFQEGYVCESNGQPPVAQIVRGPDDPIIAYEGEVCCGAAPTENDALSTGAIAGIVVGSLVAFVLVIALFFWVKSTETSAAVKPPATTAGAAAGSKDDAVSTSSEDAAETEDKV